MFLKISLSISIFPMEIQWKVPVMLFALVYKAALNECNLGLTMCRL